MGIVSSVRRDRISELPDDILLSMMPLLGLQQAAKTSILCKRWRYLWAKRARLDFNHLVILPEHDPDVIKHLNFITVEEVNKYINWVNQVVALHCGPCIDTFKVLFRFYGTHAHHVDKWVRFAISKSVKDLELNLISSNVVYTFGFDILKPSLSPSGGDISFLASLHLTNINVSGDVLELLLSRCPLLERLGVIWSRTLVRWKVSGQSCKLKQLTISYCSNLEELEIDAANLVYFDFNCTKASSKLLFKNVPVLVDVKVSWTGSGSVLPHISHFAGQISKLSLECQGIPGGLLPTFRNLKQLNLQIDCELMELDLVAMTTFLEACPVVCEFKLEIYWSSCGDEIMSEAFELMKLDRSTCPWWLRDDAEDGDDSEGGGDIEVESDDTEGGHDVEVRNVLDLEYFDITVVPQGERKTHPNLKVLHVAGFNGCSIDVELILYFVEFACNLETIICDSSRCLYDIPAPGEIEVSRSRAGKLMKIVPPKIRIQII